jgi:hypothetical protein
MKPTAQRPRRSGATGRSTPCRGPASFNEVNKAQQDRENAINIANGDYNEAVPRAKGQADQAIRAAEATDSSVNEAEGDVASFNAMLEQYQGAGNTRMRLISKPWATCSLPPGRKSHDDSMRNLLPILPLTGKPLENEQRGCSGSCQSSSRSSFCTRCKMFLRRSPDGTSNHYAIRQTG